MIFAAKIKQSLSQKSVNYAGQNHDQKKPKNRSSIFQDSSNSYGETSVGQKNDHKSRLDDQK